MFAVSDNFGYTYFNRTIMLKKIKLLLNTFYVIIIYIDRTKNTSIVYCN